MTHATTISNTHPHLEALLHRIVTTRRRITRVTRLLTTAWLWLAVLLAIVLLDAWLRFPDWLRLVELAAMVAAMVLSPLRLVLPGLAGAWRQREARHIEAQQGRADNALINAVALPIEAARGDAVTGALSRRVHERADRLAHQVDPAAMIDRRERRDAALRLLGVVLLWLAALIVQPRMFATGLIRLVDPLGDHPPFSQTVFEVSYEPREPMAGQEVMVTARLTGKVPQRVELVQLDDTDRQMARWPMHAMKDQAPGAGVFERRLVNLRQPITFRIAAGDGWSKKVTITPKQPPAPPDQGDQAGADPRDGGDGSGQPAQAATMLAAVNALRDALARLQVNAQAMSGRVMGLSDPAQMPDWLRAELERLERELAACQGNAAKLAAALRAYAASLPDDKAELREALDALAAQCQACQSTSMSPMPGTQGGAGIGGGPGQVSVLASWLDQLSAAAASDAAALGQQAAGLQQAMGGGSSVPANAAGGDIVVSPPGQGTAIEPRPGQGTNVDTSAAMATKAPPGYRELVARYFLSLGNDRPITAPPPVPLPSEGEVR
ncbi:MAG: hypothetical protein WD042_20175 [Phycisphaeraceae bacterium]